MTRPAIDPENIRRQSRSYKTFRTIRKWTVIYLIAIAIGVVYVHIFDPALNPFI